MSEDTPQFLPNLSAAIEATIGEGDWAGFVTPDHVVVKAGEIDRIVASNVAEIEARGDSPSLDKVAVATMQTYNLHAKRCVAMIYVSLPMSATSVPSFDTLAETLSLDATMAVQDALGEAVKHTGMATEEKRDD